jgi:hypothetical protein
MVDAEGENKSRSSKRLIVGSAELNYKRDGMDIQPLFSD